MDYQRADGAGEQWWCRAKWQQSGAHSAVVESSVVDHLSTGSAELSQWSAQSSTLYLKPQQWSVIKEQEGREESDKYNTFLDRKE